MSECGSAAWFQQVVEIDVSGSCAVDGRLTVAATVHLPPADAVADGATVIFALPGGGYSRGYFDMQFAGHDEYSQAEHYVTRGLGGRCSGIDYGVG